MSEEVTLTVSLPGTSKSITMFLDDTVETVRMRIGIEAGIHPDKMRIYVQSEFPADYYSKDSRRWEAAFLRMSPEGKQIGKPSLTLWAAHTEPAWNIENVTDKSSWMMVSPKRESTFTELRLLGATEDHSWIFPLDNVSDPPFVPPVSMLNIETRALFSSLHPTKTSGFRVILNEDAMKPPLELLYYPFLRAGSPPEVPAEIARSIRKQSDLLGALLVRKSPRPSKASVLRVRWKIPLVNTEFGRAPRNRFEQIFYGTTVSKTTPVISFFGSRQEQSRHKFYTASPNPKNSFLDMRTWNYWWTSTKPAKNKAALLLFRGSARFNYDRITVTATEIMVSSHRPEDKDETIESLQIRAKEWIQSIDGLSAFLDPQDLDDSRWVLQDLAASLKYSKELKVGDFRRFDCLRSLFEVMDHDKLLFKLLRASQTETGLSPEEIRVLSMLKENENTSATDIGDQLDISSDSAGALLVSVREKIGENPDILDKQFSNLPTFKFTPSSAIVTYANDLDRVSKYIDVLRDILMNPEDATLDDICPARMESVEAAVAQPVVLEALEEGGLDFLDELLGDIGEVGVVAQKEEEVAVVAAAAPPKKRIAPKGTQKSMATYFLNQMREFDPETYDPDDPQILRKCDKPRQPIIMTPDELAVISPTYDPRTMPGAVLDVKDPDGHIVCPAFWCTFDRIPLTDEQLTDRRVCPVCGGKVRSTDKAIEKTQDIIEFPIIQRDPSIIYPGYVKYKSKKNDKPIPCCFTTKQSTKVSAPKVETPSAAEAFYVLGELKARLGPLRLGYIPRMVGKALGITLNYADTVSAGNRIQAGQSGFYRVGVGHAGDTLPTVLQIAGSVKATSDSIMRCSFFRTWKGESGDGDPSIVPSNLKYRERIAGRIDAIRKAFDNKLLSPMEELEYSSLALDCQLFVIYVGDTVQIGCFMNVGAVRALNRAVIVMVTECNEPEYVSHVARITTVPQFTANLYKTQLYPPTLIKKMVEMRGKACVSDIPTIDSAVLFLNSKPALQALIPEMKVVLDPYGRAQALFSPKMAIIPFKPTAQIPTFFNDKVVGYSEIPYEDLPLKSDMLELIQEFKKFHPGFEFAHFLSNASGHGVELILRSGLRIPVQTDEGSPDQEEITETIRNTGEEHLVWGAESPTPAKDITYEAEVFDFLLYQLSYDIQTGEDYTDLKNALAQNTPQLKDLLHTWIDDSLTFSEAHDPPTFVKKMRSPCSDGDCSGSLCAWDGSSCRVEVKKVRASLERSKLERRLLTTLTTNEKIRDIVWQHRTSPFFSSVLYMEMPTELIVSDADVSKKLSR